MQEKLLCNYKVLWRIFISGYLEKSWNLSTFKLTGKRLSNHVGFQTLHQRTRYCCSKTKHRGQQDWNETSYTCIRMWLERGDFFILFHLWPWKITLKFRDLDLIVLINIWINRKCMKATVYHTDLKWKFHSECLYYKFCMLLVFLGGRKNICM